MGYSYLILIYMFIYIQDNDTLKRINRERRNPTLHITIKKHRKRDNINRKINLEIT